MSMATKGQKTGRAFPLSDRVYNKHVVMRNKIARKKKINKAAVTRMAIEQMYEREFKS